MSTATDLPKHATRRSWLSRLYRTALLLSKSRRKRRIASLLQFADAIGKLTIFFTLFHYLATAPERTKQRDYGAWQVINQAQGRATGGRIDALNDLAYDRVNLESLDIRNANIPGIDLASRDLQNAHFDGSNLKLAKFGRADIHSATFNAIRNAQTDLTGVDMRDAIAVSAQFNGASLTGADARGIDAPSTSFRKAYLGGSNFSQSPTIFGVWFIGPLLDRVLPPSVSEIFGSHTAYMAFADFANADAVGTKFRGANLYLAHFDQAKLNGADFSGAYLAGASFRGAVLTNAVFAGAVVDDRTDFTGADFAISFANYRAITKARFYERARYDSGFRELLRMPAPGPIPSDYPTPMP